MISTAMASDASPLSSGQGRLHAPFSQKIGTMIAA
jgi:hypothetical protein